MHHAPVYIFLAIGCLAMFVGEWAVSDRAVQINILLILACMWSVLIDINLKLKSQAQTNNGGQLPDNVLDP